MSVIALTIESNAQETNFAGTVTEALGLKLIDLRGFERQLAWVPEHEPAALSVRPALRQFHSGDVSFRAMSRRQLSARMREQLLDVAAEGNVVIVSWCAPVILRRMLHVPRVLVRASTGYRAAITQRHLNYSHRETACLEIESEDAAIERFVRRTFEADWRDPAAFDLIINSECINSLGSVGLMRSLMQCPRFRNEQRSRSEIARLLRTLHDEEQSTP